MSELGLLSWVVSLTAWRLVTEITITTIITTITTLVQREKKRSASAERKRVMCWTSRKTEIKEVVTHSMLLSKETLIIICHLNTPQYGYRSSGLPNVLI